MLASLKTAAVLVPLLGGVGGGVAIASAGFWAWNNWVDNPGIVRTQEAICLATVEKAASEAQMIEERRIYDASRRAAEEMIAIQLEAERQRLEEVQELENEITAYEKRLIAEDRSCRLTADDLDFLNGL